MALLDVHDLAVDIQVGSETVHVLRGVSLTIEQGERVAIVGESGSGKTISAMTAMKLLPPNARIKTGGVTFDGAELTDLSEAGMRRLRGKQIAMVFQNAPHSLNPLYTVGRQIADVHRRHNGGSQSAAGKKAVEVLAATGIPDPESRARNYPHEFSGGMAQRAMIAMALVCRPKLLIADEPTSGLDVTIQAQVLDLIRDVVAETGASLMLITHDIGQIPRLCDRIVVMYAGGVMESGQVADVMSRPANPYTRLLMDCAESDGEGEFPFIPGRAPDLRQHWQGCGFAPRCPRAEAICSAVKPPMVELGNGHCSACHFAQ